MSDEPTDKELGEIALLIYWDLEYGKESDAVLRLRKLIEAEREREIRKITNDC